MGKWNTELIHGSVCSDPLWGCFALTEKPRRCAVSANESVHSPCRESMSVPHIVALKEGERYMPIT